MRIVTLIASEGEVHPRSGKNGLLKKELYPYFHILKIEVNPASEEGSLEGLGVLVMFNAISILKRKLLGNIDSYLCFIY